MLGLYNNEVEIALADYLSRQDNQHECRIVSSRAVAVFFEPNETRYDLRWRMFGTSVRVHPMFWLVSVILGWNGTIHAGVGFVLAWVACVFVSVLLHEFGHVWMGRLFGSHGYIVLYSFGGLAIGSNHLERRWQRILVSLAGPGIQLLLAAVLIWGLWSGWRAVLVPPGWGKAVDLIIVMLLQINIFWPILNLLPIWPLDGGMVAREICQAMMPERGTSFSLGISMVLSGLLAVHMFMTSRGHPLIPLP
ncbi:MAG: metalloprotease, partial [Gemmataceae bacterium]